MHSWNSANSYDTTSSSFIVDTTALWGFGEVPRSSMAHPQVLVHSCQAHLVETETFLRRYSCHDCNSFYQLRRLRARVLDVEPVANLYATPVNPRTILYSGDED